MSNASRLALLKTLSLFLFVAPLFVLVAIDYESYFLVGTTKISLYGYVAAILAIVALKEKAFDFAKKNPPLSLSVFLFVTALIMRRFSTELMYIGLCGIIGGVLSAFVAPVEEVYYFLCYEETPSGRRKRITSEALPLIEGIKRAYL